MNKPDNSSDMNYLIALDERVEFCRDLLSSGDVPTAAEREQAAMMKRVVFDGLLKAIEYGVQKSELGLWADTDLGESVLLRASAISMMTAVSPRKGKHSLKDLNVDYTAVQLTLNPDGPEDARKELLRRLKFISDRAREELAPLLIELNSIPTAPQVEMYGGANSASGVVTLMAMQQLQEAGIAPAIWAFEPPQNEIFTGTIAAQATLDDQECKVLLVVDASLSPDNIDSSAITNESNVVELAATTLGVSGVLIGPGAYYRQLVQLNNGLIERGQAVESIASYVTNLHSIFNRSRAASKVH